MNNINFNFERLIESDFRKIEEIIKILHFENTYLYVNEKQQNELVFLKNETIEKRNFYDLLQKLNRTKDFRKILAMFDYNNFNVFYADFLDYYKNNKFVDNIVYKYNFKQKEKCKIEFFNNTLCVIKNNIEFAPLQMQKEEEIDKTKLHKYLQLYLQVFPHFFEFLNYIVYNLFDEGRKRSYIYINAKSDWGKSFLLDIFSDLGIGLRTQLNKLEKIPSPLTTSHFRNKILLMIDEFTIFKKELKELTNKFILEPKQKKQVEVQLFTKLFVSAEFSESFDDAVDEQIKNRIIVYNYHKTKKIEDLKREGIELSELHLYLKFFVKRYLQRRIAFIKRNNYDITARIDKIFHKRKIKAENIENKMLKYLLDFVSLYKHNTKYVNIHEKSDILQHTHFKVILNTKENKLYVTAFPKFLKHYLSEILNEQNFKKFAYKFKKRILHRIFEFIEVKTTINNINNNFYVLDLKYLQTKLESENKSENDETLSYKLHKAEEQLKAIKIQLQKANEQIENLQTQLKKQKKENETLAFLFNNATSENERLKQLLSDISQSFQSNNYKSIAKCLDEFDEMQIPF